MAGFVLGTGSGVLAAAAVYYTLSTSLQGRTAALRSELNTSTRLLETSFEPTKPIPASALIGPSSRSPPPAPPLTQLIQTKWNSSIASSLTALGETNWSAITLGVYEEGKGLVNRLLPSEVPVGGGGSGGSLIKQPDLRTVSGGNVRDSEEKVDGKIKSEVKRVVESKFEGRLV